MEYLIWNGLVTTIMLKMVANIVLDILVIKLLLLNSHRHKQTRLG